MSTTSSSGYREGIWEIGQDAVTAHLPEGAWHLPACDIESIRLQYGQEDGQPVCDAFLKARGSARSDLLGRYPAGKDRLCIELALFAARNRILLLGAPEESTAGQAMTTVPAVAQASSDHAGSGAETGAASHAGASPSHPGSSPSSGRPGSRGDTGRYRSRDGMRQPDDSPFQTQQAPPDQGFEPNQGFDQSHGSAPEGDFGQNQGYDPNQGFDPNQGYDPSQGADPNQGFDPNQGYDPSQGADPNQGFDPNQGYGPQGSGWSRFRSAAWWSWTFNPMNPAYHRNMLFAILGTVLVLGFGVLMARYGVRIAGQLTSGPGFIIFLILLGRMKDEKKKRRKKP